MSDDPPEQEIDTGLEATGVVVVYALEHTGAEYPDALAAVSLPRKPVTDLV